MNEEKVVPTCCAPQEAGGPDLEQQRVLEHPLNWLDEVRLQGGRVLLLWVLGVQERLESCVRLGWKSLNTD